MDFGSGSTEKLMRRIEELEEKLGRERESRGEVEKELKEENE